MEDPNIGKSSIDFRLLRQLQQQQQQQQHHHHHHHHRQPNNQKPSGQAQPVKVNPPVSEAERLLRAAQGHQRQLQRKLLSFLFAYAILLVCLCLTYAAYSLYQRHLLRLSQLGQPPGQPGDEQADGPRASESLKLDADQPAAGRLDELASKLHLLERYVELVALDLEQTKARLREREKCQCLQSCLFNGTTYADQSAWRNQCDTCTCQSGRISCSPQKCPPSKCDDAIQLPGHCCPACPRKCKHNNLLLSHNQRFRPKSEPRKECKCLDGLIKCDLRPAGGQSQNSSSPADTQREPTQRGAGATRLAGGSAALADQSAASKRVGSPDAQT